MRKIVYLSSILVITIILSGCNSSQQTAAPINKGDTRQAASESRKSTSFDYKKIVPGISSSTIQKLEAGERVVVIVGVSLPDATKKYNPETDAPKAAKVMDEVIAGLNHCYSNTNYYQFIPYFAITVNNECLEELSTNKEVKSIEENKAYFAL